MMLEPVVKASPISTNWKPGLDQMISSSQKRLRCIMQIAAALHVSIR